MSDPIIDLPPEGGRVLASSQLCNASCQAVPGIGARRVSPKPTGAGGCTRKATYTDGRHFYCTQHAKEPPTILRKATGRIRLGLYPIPTEADALCAAQERRDEGR